MASSKENAKLSELKQSIRKDVILSFLDGSVHEVSEIAAATGVSRQTVKKSLDIFVSCGLAIVAGKGSSGTAGGKKPLLYSLNPDRYLICVTLWERAFIINLFNMNREPIDRLLLEIPLPDSLKTAAENIGRLSSILLEKNGIDLQKVRCVSVSVPGNVDPKTNTLIFSAPAPAWGTNVPLADYLKPYFAKDTRIILLSSAKTAPIHYLLEDKLANRRLLVISVTPGGVSGCLVENGHVLNGTNALIGEIGHMIVDPNDEEVCGCGSRGCLNVRLSPARLRKLIAREKDRNPESPLLNDRSELPCNAIFRAAEQEDPLADYCADYIMANIAVVLHNASVVFDPDYVIFSGRDFIGNETVNRKLYHHLNLFRYYPVYRNPFELIYDDCDLFERDAAGAMLAMRFEFLNGTAMIGDPEEQDEEKA